MFALKLNKLITFSRIKSLISLVIKMILSMNSQDFLETIFKFLV